MKKIESVSEMRSAAAQLKSAGKTIALVPTMGALHAGQEALIRAAVKKADVVVVSLFVNPLQFGPNEAMANYPRSMAEDLQLCEAAGAHIVFAPSVAEMYPRGYSTYVSEEHIARSLCGLSRPAHFRGVTTMMANFFNVRPPNARRSCARWRRICILAWRSWSFPRCGRRTDSRRACTTAASPPASGRKPWRSAGRSGK